MSTIRTSLLSLILSLLCFILISGCETEVKNPNFQSDAADPVYLNKSMMALSQTIKYDLFAPVVASRIYFYAHVASYEALNAQNPAYKSLQGQLKGLTDIPKPDLNVEYCYPVSAVRAYLRVGKKLIFSEDTIAQFEKQIISDFKKIGVPKAVLERSLAFGDTVAAAIIKWSTKDNYAQSRSMPKYTVTPDNPNRWRPTSPDYGDALEPHWHKIRTAVMDSAAQFKPIPPPKFDIAKSSYFYKMAFETFKIVQDSTPDKIATAWYWDDNPVATFNAGHVNISRKKISPGGHWLWITMYAAQQKKFDIYSTNEAYTYVAIGLYDAFISCWDEKYRSEVIRPESYITKYINSEWISVIVTPPFPEYTSGHSCISGASSTILTQLFGDNFRFTDSTELQFGLAPRSYNSFNEAARETAVSRFYAGIHYLLSCEIGLQQGQRVGKNVLEKVRTR